MHFEVILQSEGALGQKRPKNGLTPNSIRHCKYNNRHFRIKELSPIYDKFPQIVLPNGGHMSSIKQKRV